MVKTIRTVVEAPKWAKLPSFIKNVCWFLGLDCKVEVDKGWISENIRFMVSGEEGKVAQFIKAYNDATYKWNNE